MTTIVLMVAITASCVVAGVLAGRFNARIDITATREHALSERTVRMLDRLDGPHTIVVSADAQSVDARARQRVRDVITELTQASPLLDSLEIDTSSSEGQAMFVELLTRLAGQYADEAAQHTRVLAEVASACEYAGENLAGVARQLRAFASRLPGDVETDLNRQADLLVRLGVETTRAGETVQTAADHSVLGVKLPQGDVAQEAAMVRLEQVARAMDELGRYARALGASSDDAVVQNGCTVLADEAGILRDLTATASDELRRLRPLVPLLIARVLQAQNAVLLVSADDVQAIEFDVLFPPSSRIDAAGGSEAEIRFAGEELIATALGGMNLDGAPVLVFVHGESERLFDSAGRPSSVGLRAFRRLFERMRLRGIDMTEWAVQMESARPRPSEVMGRIGASVTGAVDDDRPIVWVMLGPPARARNVSMSDWIAALERQSEALLALVQDGEPVLLSLDPSDIAARMGEDDPIGATLSVFGIDADTARPILRRQTAPSAEFTYTYQIMRQADADHPIGGAIDGLGVILPWTTGLSLPETPPSGVTVSPLLQVESDVRTWAESEWLAFRYASARDALQPLALSDPPRPDTERDGRAGPWTVAAAVERTVGTDAPQRMVVVASPTWFADQYTQLAEVVQNRRVWRFPGNGELFEASVYWLAGLDEYVAPSPQARDIDRIDALTDGQVLAIRWLLIAGMPVLVLLTGALLRVMRG